MASVDDCRAALARLAAALAESTDGLRAKVDLDRIIVCRVTDLDVAFRGRLRHGTLVDLREEDDPQAKIRLSAISDDLIAMVDGQLDFATALATRRVSIRASPMDLLRLGRLL